MTSSQKILNDQRKILRNAFKVFNENSLGIVDRRNQVQERILAASNHRCAVFKRHLKKLDAQNNFILGSFATALAGAGAIFTPVNTVRTLSGLAGIFSGVRAEFNEVYFQTKTIQVITDGIRARRKKIYERILGRQKTDITVYLVEAAIKDAVTYHDNCSLIAGLEEAALSIERAENPGMVAMQKVLIQSKNLQRIMNADPDDPSLYTRGIVDPIIRFDGAGTDLLDDGSTISRGSPLFFYASTRSQISRVANAFGELVKKLKEDSNIKKLKQENSNKSTIADLLDEVKELMRDVGERTKKLLQEKFGKVVMEIDGNLRNAWVRLAEALPHEKVELRRRRLVLEDVKTRGETVNNNIRGLFRVFQTYAKDAKSILVKEKKIGTLTDVGVGEAVESLRWLIAEILTRRVSGLISKIQSETDQEKINALEKPVLGTETGNATKEKIAEKLQADSKVVSGKVKEKDNFNSAVGGLETKIDAVKSALK